MIRAHLLGVLALYRRVGSVGSQNKRFLSRSFRKHLKGMDPTFDPAVLRPLLAESRYWNDPTDYDCGVVAGVVLYDDLSLDDADGHHGNDAPSVKVPLVERIPDEASDLPYRYMEQGWEADLVVQKALGWMTVRERELCKRRVLDPEGGTTLEEFGERWGVTRQRVQQIEVGAVEKLKRAFRLVTGAGRH